MEKMKSIIKGEFSINPSSIHNPDYQMNNLLDTPCSEVCISSFLNEVNPVKVVMNSSQQVRFVAVDRLEKILSCNVPTILFDEECNPYVVSTPERDALQLLSCDISPVVHICAKTAFNRIKEKELKQTVSFLLKKYGMYELAISLGMDLNNSLTKKLVRQEILGLPTDKEIQKKSKKYFSSLRSESCFQEKTL